MSLLRNSAIILALPIFCITNFGCGKFSHFAFVSYSGNGEIATEYRAMKQFNKIEFDGDYEVILSQSEPSEIRIETDKNLFEHIKTTITNGKLTVESDGNLEPTKKIKIFISSPAYNAIELDGSGNIRSETPINSDDLALDLSGSGEYQLEVHSKQLKSSVAGSGTIKLWGTTGSHSIDIAGSGDLVTDSLAADSVKVEVNGSGDASVNAAKHLWAEIAGSGNVHYTGAVTDIHSRIEGSGSIERMKE